MAEVKTVGDLKASGARVVSVKEEMRRNLIRRLKEGKPLFPGIIGYEKTVVPAIQNALLARHDFILLGLRGQGKSRILRALVDLLDEKIPVVPGCEINDHPLAPMCKRCRRTVTDQTEIGWMAREDRYREKLATPDVTMADLIGDIDPIKAANERRSLSDEEVIHYGILPRTHRGIFAINELPDLQTRIQVGLLNIMEERDVQIRGFPIRLAIDVCIVYTANPEDYTNRGSIITPLKDRIDSQILTHYPTSIEDAMSITEQEAWTKRGDVAEVRVPKLVAEIVEEIGFQARKSEFVDQNSGVSARMSISAMENIVSNCERRALRSGESKAVPRICDLYAAVPAIAGKIELVYEGEREGVVAVARRILGQAVQAAFKRSFPDAVASKPVKQKSVKGAPGGSKDAPLDDTAYKPVLDWFAKGNRVEITDAMSSTEYAKALEQVPGLKAIAEQHLKPASDQLPLAMEFILEGLHQNSLVAREDLDAAVSYKDMLKTMFESMGSGRGDE
ncbi:MAG TPA: magnesium chelatase [Planctomycetota bacterium]|nr:magnesium chelatase [Planctomycetota bacterium]